MKRITRFNGILLALAMVLLLASVALAAAGYDLAWWTVDGGGTARLESGSYSLSGTVGQPDAGELSADEYVLNGGFWFSLQEQYTYLPLINGQ
jgi:hypothetical protein